MLEVLESSTASFDLFDRQVDAYLERVRWESCSAGAVRRGHVADVVSGSGDSVGALLAETSGDLLAEMMVMALTEIPQVCSSNFLTCEAG